MMALNKQDIEMKLGQILVDSHKAIAAINEVINDIEKSFLDKGLGIVYHNHYANPKFSVYTESDTADSLLFELVDNELFLTECASATIDIDMAKKALKKYLDFDLQ